jgi:ribosomal protein S18 acetylase RimI-like enzyme
MKIKELPLGECEKLKEIEDKLLEPFSKELYLKNLGNKRHLILVAEEDGQIIGYKTGYEKGEFYSWTGGVLPEHRRKGIASQLADAQEKWAKKQGFKTVWFKTDNRYKPMMIFALKRGFDIVKTAWSEQRRLMQIILEKKL